MQLAYQFNVNFINKNSNWSKHVLCITHSICKYSYLFELVGSVVSDVQKISNLSGIIKDLEAGKTNHPEGYMITDEGTAGLLVQGPKTKIIDFIHTENGQIDGEQGPINYNIYIPEEDQYLPTDLVIELLNEWQQFIVEQEEMRFVPKQWLKPEYAKRITD